MSDPLAVFWGQAEEDPSPEAATAATAPHFVGELDIDRFIQFSADFNARYGLERMWPSSRPYCMDHAGAFICTRPVGHTGPHAAHASRVLAAWPQRGDVPR